MKNRPVIAMKILILKAAKANDLFENGTVVGNVMLHSPEILEK
jgi:hypothetical protein